jgi:hypothetical protein
VTERRLTLRCLALPRLGPVLVALLMAAAAAAQDGGAPLSAIDWLSRSVEGSGARSADRPPIEPPVAASASTPAITVTPLDGGPPRAGGVLAPEATGLPPTLWSGSDEGALLSLMGAAETVTLPALRELVVTLMLAEADPPAGAGPEGRLFLARVDKLLDMGAVEPAQALLEADDRLWPEAFRRWFDAALLTGTEDAACEVLRGHPSLAPTLKARVFCTARNGDWPAAALTLNTARVLGDVTPEEEWLLARFLDPEFAEENESLLPPSRPSPLDFRLREAIGEAVPTAGLPLAFAHADLRPVAAWRAQIEAAERLARNGVLSENVLLGLYTARDPAASGGVWDRAATVQALDAALAAGDAAAVAAALPRAWAAMSAAGLEVPFARLFGPRLQGVPLDGEAADLAFRVALLSPAYEEAALAREPASPRERLWRGVARGDVAGLAAEGEDGASAAVVAGFAEGAAPSPALAEPIAAGRVGEAILKAVAAFDRGLDGDRAALTDAIAALRALGLEDTARRAALQFLILEGAA